MVKSHFDLKKLASLPNFYMPTLSHDQTKMALYYDVTGRIELYVLDLITNEMDQISKGEVPHLLRSGFIWGRDNRTIFFAKDNNGDEQHNIFAIDTVTKETRQLTDTPQFQEHVAHTSPDGEWITFNSNRNGQMNVYKMRYDGSEVTQLTATDNPSFGGVFSPDGKYIAFMHNEEADLRNNDIYLLDLESGDIERVIQMKIGSQDGFVDWKKDSSGFYFNSDASGSSKPGVFDLETKSIKFFGEDLSQSLTGVKMTSDGSKLIALENKDGSISPIIFDTKSGEYTRPNFPPGIAAGGQLKDDEILYLTVNMPTSPSSLIAYNLVNDTSDVILKPDTGDIDSSLFTDAEHIWYKSGDGTMIPAILYKPRDFDPSKKYPGIVNPHGGPTGQYFMNFSVFAQFITDLGYVLLQPNVRGSTGYGNEFRDACIKDWGGKDHEDWVAGRQYLIDEASVDPDRVAVFGGSYGGYATLVCMTKSPDLWRAGIAWVPVSGLKNLYSKSMEHFKYYFRMQMGDPEKDSELWEERSPINFVENIKNPLLLVHGVNDPRCDVSESRNVVARLEELGRKRGEDFEYVEFGDEGHGGMSDINHRIRTFEILADFLDRRLN